MAKKPAGGYHISNDKGKADANAAGLGPGPIRGSSFGKSNQGPKQGEITPQPKRSWHKGKIDDAVNSGDGDES